jgi:ABC-type phosphate transport system substrate-binding protein
MVAVLGMTAMMLMAGPAAAAPAFTPNYASDYVRLGGSDTTYQMMNDLAQLYTEAPGCVLIVTAGAQPLDGKCIDFTPGGTVQAQFEVDGDGNPTDSVNTDHDTVMAHANVGSSVGINMLANRGSAGVQTIEIARSSRAPRPADIDGLRFFAYAKDALAPVKFPGATANAVTSLTQAQTTNIWVNCSVTGWGQIGGVAGQPIAVWASQAGSGTRAAWDEKVGGNSSLCIPTSKKDNNQANGERIILENNAQPITDSTAVDCDDLTIPGQNAANPCAPNSLFNYSVGPYTVTGGEGSILLSVDGIAPTTPNITNDTFPYTRLMYNVIRQGAATMTTGLASNATRNFMTATGFICKPNTAHVKNPRTGVNFGVEIENVIRDNGFIPLPVGTTGGGLPNSKCRITDTVNVN